ncbi:MAG: hypothetical protein KI790_11635 [Cyclobacteriaceae bacterium]|nr:hypothetical protein [Cyclobacteriaceae bacterium HetDA_MAG_MS6]
MKKLDELFALIKSLSQSEKRYFKILAKGSKGDSNLIDLFQVVDHLKVYSEVEVIRKLHWENGQSRLAVAKNQLKHLIYKALRNYHQHLSKDSELKVILRNVEILFSKELYSHCRAELVRAENLAKKNELFTGLLEVYSWWRRVEQHKNPHDYTAFAQLLDHQRKIIHLINNRLVYNQLILDVSVAMSQRSKSKVRNEDLLNNPENALSREAKVMHYNSLYFRRVQQGENDKTKSTLQELIVFLESDQERLEQEPGMYFTSLNNLISYCVFNKEYKYAIELIGKIKDVYGSMKKAKGNRNLLKQLLRTLNIELEIYRDGHGTLQPDTLNYTTHFVQVNESKMPKDYLVSFCFQFASLYFVQYDLKRALYWINYLLNSTRLRAVRPDLQRHARILNLMIHLEQENFFVLRYFVDSTRRYLKKYDRLADHEVVLLKFFSRIGKAPILEHKRLFMELNERLFEHENVENIPNEILDYLRLKPWLERKLSKVSVSQ